jgi:hypothetical protein
MSTVRGDGSTRDSGLLRIGLFFDGTRNNARNLARGRGRGGDHPGPPQALPPIWQADDASPYHSRITSSFNNGLTNVARLHALYADGRVAGAAAPSVAIYTEGTGTRDGQADDLIGLAFGVGASGVRAKINRALQAQLPAALAQLARHWQQPLRGIRVDLFGFSRGAAAARDVANQIAAWGSPHWQGLLREAGLRVDPAFTLPHPVIGFIGLFDTVVAIRGGRADEAPRLHLPAGIAGKVLQLSARDEHREHFALTTVAPDHEEIRLPGVHANIGGGYDQTEEGPKLLTRPRSQQVRRHGLDDFALPPADWLHRTESHQRALAEAVRWQQQLGLGADVVWVDTWHQWVRQRQAGSHSALPTPTLFVYSAVVLKRPIDWRYQLIALRLMHARAAAAGVRWTDAPDACIDGTLPTDLRGIAAALMAGTALEPAQERVLKQRYLMQSAHWNFDALGDTALSYTADAGVSELPYRPGPGLFYINRPTADGQRVVLRNA